jgi:Bacterial Ig-like domain/Fibronectin type III domain
MRTLIRSLALLAASLVIASSVPVRAGTVAIAWDPVPDTDVAGYRVYYGTSPTSYTSSVDVGNVTQTTVSGLTDCTTYYFGVKAYDTAANESTAYSNQVQGWTRPVVTSETPSSAEQGRTLSLTIAGSSFPAGAIAAFSNAGITVNSTTVNACGQLTVNVTIGASAAPGTSNMDVTGPDGVFGTGTALFTVVAAVAPTIASTTPADGGTGVSVAVSPTVTFSEAMLASSITTGTIKLLDSTGAAVAQAAGSPALSGSGLTATITPAAALTQGKTYKIQVVGGASGVLDLANHGMASTVTQATGFSTVSDSTPPTITAVASSGVASTTATVTWTTNETSDSQVFYRKTGAAAYQQTDVNATLATSHTRSLAGLEPANTYEYYVRSADAAGNAATSSPTKTFVTTSNAFTYLRFEAESGTLVAPVRANSGAADAFGGGYLDTPSGTANGTATSPAGTATFGVSIPSAGTWYLWVRLYGPDANTDTWYESINGAARQQIVASVPGQWMWVAGRSYSLSAGLASLELGGRNAQARADRVLITDDPTFVPTEQPVGDLTPPASDTGFTATGAAAQVTLAWTHSSSPDAVQTIIRYRTDGKYPVSPVDGTAVVTKSGSPGAADSFVQTGLVNGTTYSFSAFAVDSSGNVAQAAKAQATAADTTAPANVQNLRRSDKH